MSRRGDDLDPEVTWWTLLAELAGYVAVFGFIMLRLWLATNG